MPVCNFQINEACDGEFDVEESPGALMFGHPSTVSEAVPVWKAHICQPCEQDLIEMMTKKPIKPGTGGD